MQTFQGVVKGNIIELNADSGLPEGQAVTITIQPRGDSARIPGDGIRRSAGAWAADGEELDRYLETTRQLRRSGHREISE